MSVPTQLLNSVPRGTKQHIETGKIRKLEHKQYLPNMWAEWRQTTSAPSLEIPRYLLLPSDLKGKRIVARIRVRQHGGKAS